MGTHLFGEGDPTSLGFAWEYALMYIIRSSNPGRTTEQRCFRRLPVAERREGGSQMRRVLTLTLVVMLFGLLGPGALTAQISKSLAVPLFGQETSMWCWAASGEMVMTFLGSSVSQGVQANNRFGRTDCTRRPPPSSCAIGGWWEYWKYGYSANTLWGSALSWNQVKAEIDANRPIWFAWAWSGGGGHAMVAKGYFDWNLWGIQYRFVEINNPWPPSTFVDFSWLGLGVIEINGGENYYVTYDEWVARAGSHSHWTDWYNIRR